MPTEDLGVARDLGLALVAAVASQLPALAAVSWSHDYGFSFATLQHMTGDGVAVITLVYVSTSLLNAGGMAETYFQLRG